MLTLTGTDLTLEDVERVARAARPEVRLGEEARRRVRAARALVEKRLEGDERVYGITTGFGRLSDVTISAARRRELQLNLVRSHASGVGDPLPEPEVRAIVLARANALAAGASGCRPVVIDRLLDLLRHGITPRVPEFGSVGASGDLAPLAAVALVLVGEGLVLDGRGPDGGAARGARPAAAALREAGLETLELEEKEGLALINGTQASAAPGVLVLLAAERALETAEVAGAMSSEGLRATPEPFREEVQRVRPHPGQARTARRIRALLADSEIRESHRHGDPRVQDAYSVRCMPQVHGAAREVLFRARETLSVELNSATDNPLVFPEAEEGGGAVVSAGNFHAQIVAQALDFLAIALADLAAISERRTERLLNPDLSGLPAFLAREPGIESGFMIAHVTASDLLSEMRRLAAPASVDSVPTGAGKEDHVAMAPAALRKARRAVRCLEYVLAVELACGAEALDRLEPLRPGRGVARAHEAVRETVPPLVGDRSLTDDLEALARRVREGAFARIVEGSER